MALDLFSTRIPARALPTVPRVLDALRRLAVLVARWREKARSRERLARLPPELLRDVGLSEDAARDEAGRPFWD